MKFHIVQAGETIDVIKKKYKMDDKEFSVLNPDCMFKKYSIGDSVRVKDSDNTTKIVENIETIYESKGTIDHKEEKKYICPHCKNIIVIPS